MGADQNAGIFGFSPLGPVHFMLSAVGRLADNETATGVYVIDIMHLF
jgi:hypothetical protein